MNLKHLMTPIAVGVVVVGAVAIGTSLSKARAELGAEAAFREARRYTVRIRTRIETPFLGDEEGAFEGAGFLIDRERGWIVTNAHVVGQSPSNVEVAFAGEEFQPARKIYVDSFADIAIIAVTPKPGRPGASPSLTLPTVGDPVGAFGHPLGMPFTGTRGIVSGLTDRLGPDLIQIDATIDHGNSGGPVISLLDGRVIGIATSGAGGDKADRLNFATPIAGAVRILDLLRRGVSPQPPRMAFALVVDEDDRFTLRVGRTFEPERWPFEPGDRIVKLSESDDSLQTVSDLVNALRGRTEPVPLTIERSGRRIALVVRPTLQPAILARRGVRIDGALLGPIAFEDERALTEPARLILHSVDPTSAAQTLGLQSYDVLSSLDGRTFSDLDSLAEYLRRRPRGQAIEIVLRRGTANLYRYWDYHFRTLPGDEIKMVPESTEPVAASP